MPIKTDKIIAELSKGDSDEMLVALDAIKLVIFNKLNEEQQAADELATKKQSQIDRLNNNN